jgi:methylaspartate ammonia-lyase
VFDSDAQRAAFERVARTAESVLYGPSGGASEQLAAVLEEGRRLLAQLSATPPASGAR